MVRALILDVELSRAGAVHGLAGLGPDGEEVVAETARAIPEALDQLARLARDAEILVGHNLARHDRPWLARFAADHPALRLPWADTLVLSPLAFPERPYHRLIKEHRLVREGRPAPLADCRANRTVLQDEIAALTSLQERDPALTAFARAALEDPRAPLSNPGYGILLDAAGVPFCTLEDALPPLCRSLAGLACRHALDTLSADPALALPLAYVAAWTKVPPGSTLPAWARHTHPEIDPLLTALRGRPCGDPHCQACLSLHAPEGWLERMFGYAAFRPTPASPSGGSLQREIVAAGLADRPLYAVLPTGTGKSLCFQIPAAARHRRRGDLTVVISPLQSLMKDQVDQLRERDPHATTVNGSLTAPERARALEEVREGYTSLVYLSPEQLRNRGVRQALEARTIGAWVIDEAHCLTDWGHDFRTDYLYIPRFARELAARQGRPVPPFQCFTGTSQVAVTAAILALLKAEVGQELLSFDGGSERDNLVFSVEERAGGEKLGRLYDLLETHLPERGSGAAIVFCATRGEATEVGKLLGARSWEAAAYHAGLDGQTRREVQDRFLRGELQVIAATSAFGMGVDKPDVRLVVHLDVPPSLEAYLQQAGRAGRDREMATCVLLFAPGDIDKQFRLASQGQLSLRDLQALWRGLQRIPARKEISAEGELEERVVTRGELARLDGMGESFDPEDPITDTRLTAGVSWLERAGLLRRDENRTAVFQGVPRLPTLEAAVEKVATLDLTPARARLWEALLARLYDTTDERGLSADDLADLAANLDPGEASAGPVGGGTRLLGQLQQMVATGLLTAGTRLSAFLAWGVPDPSRERAAALLTAHRALLRLLPELSPDPGREWISASPLRLSDALQEQGVAIRPERVVTLLRGLERDGLGLRDAARSLDLRFLRPDHLAVRLRRSWEEIGQLGRLREEAAGVVMESLDRLAAEKGARGGAVMVGFALEDLVKALEGSLLLHGQLRSPPELVDQTLLLLHDARVLTLHSGLAVFRQAMVIRRARDAPRAAAGRGGGAAPAPSGRANAPNPRGARVRAARVAGHPPRQELSRDWFQAPREVFLKRWFDGRKEVISRATSPSPTGPSSRCSTRPSVGW